KHLDRYNQARANVATFYNQAFENCAAITTPKTASYSTHVFHQYTILFEGDRDALITHLASKGIPSMIYYPVPGHKQKMFDAFDEDDNKDGSRIKIILATGRAFEGTDLKALRYVHIAEPVVSPLMERQLVGRGVRLCGHIQLPPKERTVTIVRWYAMPPPASTRNVMISSAQRAHSGSGKKLPTLLFRNRNTNNVTKLSLTQALQRVRNASDRYGTTGWEYAARNEALQRKDSILLSSFENYVARRASSKTRPSFTLLKKFQIIPGRACPKS
ncbi:hypothetical protein EBT31_21925, partial [bacterium]|nr:hypothetical protein [bacterium]